MSEQVLSKDGLSFLHMIMEHEQKRCDALRAELKEERNEEKKKLDTLKKYATERISKSRKIIWAIEEAQKQISFDVFLILKDSLKSIIYEETETVKMISENVKMAQNNFNRSFAGLN